MTSKPRGGQPSVLRSDHPGNTEISLVDLFKLEKINEVTFRSIALPHAPGGPWGNGNSYGGHVYAQAVWAAAQTVPDGFVLHHVSGNFILQGMINTPWVYKVHNIRDGKSYCTRIVNVTQASNRGICYTCTCSFKTPEGSVLDEQDSLDLWAKYAAALKDRKPADLQDVDGMDVPFYWDVRKKTGKNDVFPGLDMRKVDMAAYNDGRHPLDRRNLLLYRPRGDAGSDPNMHIVGHLYASDRNSLFIVANHLDLGHYWTQMTSLVHTVVIHGPVEDLLFRPSESISSPLDDVDGRWFAKEDWGSRVANGRVLFHSRVWNSNGAHIMTVMQDGLTRWTQKPSATREEIQAIEDVRGKWPKREKL